MQDAEEGGGGAGGKGRRRSRLQRHLNTALALAGDRPELVNTFLQEFRDLFGDMVLNLTVNSMLDGNAIHKNQLDNTPKTQILAYSEDDDQEPEEKTYWCAICKSRLVYLNHSDTVWRCDNCMTYYDTKIQDTPTRDKSDFKLRAHHNPYQQFDENDTNVVYVKGINPDQDEQHEKSIEVIRSSADQRIQHIRVRGNLADALRATSSEVLS